MTDVWRLLLPQRRWRAWKRRASILQSQGSHGKIWEGQMKIALTHTYIVYIIKYNKHHVIRGQSFSFLFVLEKGTSGTKYPFWGPWLVFQRGSYVFVSCPLQCYIPHTVIWENHGKRWKTIKNREKPVQDGFGIPESKERVFFSLVTVTSVLNFLFSPQMSIFESTRLVKNTALGWILLDLCGLNFTLRGP